MLFVAVGVFLSTRCRRTRTRVRNSDGDGEFIIPQSLIKNWENETELFLLRQFQLFSLHLVSPNFGDFQKQFVWKWELSLIDTQMTYFSFHLPIFNLFLLFLFAHLPAISFFAARHHISFYLFISQSTSRIFTLTRMIYYQLLKHCSSLFSFCNI